MSDNWLANPSLPADILAEAVPGNIRRAEHFLAFLRRFVQYLGTRLQATQVRGGAGCRPHTWARKYEVYAANAHSTAFRGS